MRIYCEKDYNAMSRRAAAVIAAQVVSKPECVLGLATGSTPIGAYRQLVEWHKRGDLSSVVRAVFKMFGPDRVVLISDTMRAAGMTDGKYDLGGQEVTVKGPLATLADGTIAGSVTDLMACLKTAVSFGIPLADAVRAAAVNSAQAIGVFDRVGSLEPGKRANVVVLDGELNVKNVFFHGKQVV